MNKERRSGAFVSNTVRAQMMEHKNGNLKKIITLPNMITFVRILGTICLLFVRPFTLAFYIIYTISGCSDVLDGWVARATKSTSEFGAKLDSVADLLFYAMMLIRILPLLLKILPGWIWYCIGLVLLVRLCAYLTAALKYHCFATLHTYFNKLTGFVVFLIPYVMELEIITEYSVGICVIGGISSLEELLIHLSEKHYDMNRRTILKHNHTL